MAPTNPALARALRLRETGRSEQAIEALRAFLKHRPADGAANAVLGELLFERRSLTEALVHLDRALAASPGDAMLHIGRAAVLRDLGRHDEAVHAAEAAVRLNQRLSAAHAVLASIHLAANNHPDAAEAALRAFQLDPGATAMGAQAGHSLVLSGDTERGLEILREVLGCDPDQPLARSALTTALLCSVAADPAEISPAVRRAVMDWASDAPARPPIADPDPDRPLRVGYLAQDISEHSPIAFFFEPILAHHDRAAFPTTVYLTQPGLGRMSPRMLGHIDRWVDVSRLTDEAMERRFRDDRIDIIVELAGHTPGNRLRALVHHPAAIIITAIGCPMTTGAPGVDARLVDATTDPPECDRFWTERLWRLPACFLCYQPPVDAPPPRAARDASDTTPITFGSTSVAHKIGPRVVGLWSRLLREVPGSRLLLKAKSFEHPRAAEVFRERFTAHGVGDRVEILPPDREYLDHVRFYQRLDVWLDPFPYNGTTTICEALWMGVPVVTLRGRAHAGRVGASLLSAAGLPDLIAPDAESYLAVARGLAADPPRLAALHRDLRARVRASSLCDGAVYTRALEATYRQMWRERCRSEAPALDVVVRPIAPPSPTARPPSDRH